MGSNQGLRQAEGHNKICPWGARLMPLGWAQDEFSCSRRQSHEEGRTPIKENWTDFCNGTLDEPIQKMDMIGERIHELEDG